MTTTNPAAGWILDSAKRTVCQDRTQLHGETQPSFWAIAQMWQAYLRVTHAVQKVPEEINITAEDVAQMMSLLKKVRHIFGNKINDENFTDDTGYVAIAGMFAGIKEGVPITAVTTLNRLDLTRVESAARGTAAE
jgi:hypothetical protein